MRPAPQAIIFDCDGTLLLTADLHFAAIKDAVAAQGATMAHDWYLARTGLDRAVLLDQFRQVADRPLDLSRLIDQTIRNTIDRASEAVPNPVVADFARRCAARLPIAVATNSEGPVVRAFLAATGLAPIFDCVVARDDVARGKPAPDLFLLTAARFGFAPEACLVLEDSAQGLEAVATAGMTALDVRDA